MAQQLVNGSYRKSDVTFTFRMSDRYAVVSEPFQGKHKKPQDVRSRLSRKQHWRERNADKVAKENVRKLIRKKLEKYNAIELNRDYEK